MRAGKCDYYAYVTWYRTRRTRAQRRSHMKETGKCDALT